MRKHKPKFPHATPLENALRLEGAWSNNGFWNHLVHERQRPGESEDDLLKRLRQANGKD